MYYYVYYAYKIVSWGDLMNNEVVLEESSAKPRRTNLKIAIIGIFMVILLGSYLVYSFNSKYMYNGKIANNLFVEDINISSITKEEAINLINEKYKPQTLSLSYNNDSFKIQPNDIDIKYNINEVVNDAYNYTKTDSYFENVKRLFELKKTPKEFTLKTSFDEKKLDKTLEKMAEEINMSPKNATLKISNGNFITTSSRVGKEFNTKENKQAIVNVINDRTYSDVNLKVNTIEPKVSTSMVKSVNSLLSEHTTSFNQKLEGRSKNIKVSSDRISDVLLMPGEVFSYNKQTGVRTISNGYFNAPVIVNGKLEDAPGGGVCQTSTTLYNAVLYSGLKINSVRNHSLTSAYAPRGKDAMVNDSGTDFKFSNPYNHPVYIKSIVNNGKITCQVYGNAADKPNVEIKLENFNMGAKTYRVFKDNSGKKIKTEYIATSVYKK